VDISGSTSGSVTLNQSILRSANKQPELALQLLQKSLEGVNLQSAPSPSKPVSPVTVQARSRIDILA